MRLPGWFFARDVVVRLAFLLVAIGCHIKKERILRVEDDGNVSSRIGNTTRVIGWTMVAGKEIGKET